MARRLPLALLLPGAAALLAVAPAAPGLPDAPQAKDCECLGWKRLYATRLRNCGIVFEGPKYCDGFWRKLEANLCVNVLLTPDLGQWCYVNDTCSALNGGTIVRQTRGLSWKLCRRGDAGSRSLDVSTLLQHAAADGINPLLMLRMAYPTFPHAKWREVKEYFRTARNATGASRLPAKLQGRIEELLRSRQRTAFDSEDGKPPFGILDGDRFWETDVVRTSLVGGGGARTEFWELPWTVSEWGPRGAADATQLE
mmetsp:Transcript_18687/g.50706  ORF Transcript_18687/g.50706 Transcript_18687/m.50706 type:complete len:254 (-) Transcript_18687:122-883(-)